MTNKSWKVIARMFAMQRKTIILINVFFLLVGILTGGYLFSDSQPRSFLSLDHCNNCLSTSEIYGLLASVGINKIMPFVPLVVFQTNKTVVFKYPFPEGKFRYVFMPKKDIKNIGEVSEEDSAYITDAFLAIRYIVEREGLSKYRVCTNGPSLQEIAYLHFNLVDW